MDKSKLPKWAADREPESFCEAENGDVVMYYDHVTRVRNLVTDKNALHDALEHILELISGPTKDLDRMLVIRGHIAEVLDKVPRETKPEKTSTMCPDCGESSAWCACKTTTSKSRQ